MKFPYYELPRNPSPAFPDARSWLVPIIPIKIRYEDKEFNVDGLADSGSSGCIFPQMLGLGLGIDVKKGPSQKIHGLGGATIIAHFHEVTLQLGRHSWKTYVGFSPYELGVGCLLGQRGFFSQFRVTFDRRSNVTIVRNHSFWHRLRSPDKGKDVRDF